MCYNVFQTSSEISPSSRLLPKVCIWYRCQNRTEKYYHHDGEQLTLSTSTIYQSTGWEKKNFFVIFVLQ